MSDGPGALRQLFSAHAGTIALVPAARIAAGVLPQNTTLPAISLMTVSAATRNLPNPGSTRHVTELVQATVLAEDYPAAKAILRQLRLAAADRMPTVSGITNVVVLLDGQGPDFMDEAGSIYMTTQDFRVSYNEPR